MINYKKNKKKITAVGAGLIDYLYPYNQNYTFHIKGIKKSEMALIKNKIVKQFLKKIKKTPTIVPGGSSCNTITGIGKLNIPTKFVSKIGNDTAGKILKKILNKNNVETHLLTSKLKTGLVLSIISVDAERTMLTHIGASSEITPNEINSKIFKNTRITYLEGYLFSNIKLMISILKNAKISGTIISLDLSNFTIVKNNKKIINNIVKKYVDILIGNKDEIKMYIDFKKRNALRSISQNVKMAIIKMGAKGSYILYKNHYLKIPAQNIKPVIDTTGAGDLWSSGFLFGIFNKLSLKKNGKLASIFGGEVCKNIGANISKKGWQRIKKTTSQLLYHT